jgi:hypothetical protein
MRYRQATSPLWMVIGVTAMRINRRSCRYATWAATRRTSRRRRCGLAAQALGCPQTPRLHPHAAGSEAGPDRRLPLGGGRLY